MRKDRRVLRGVFGSYQYHGAYHLIVDDMNFNQAWRVTKFVICPVDVTSSGAGSRDCVAVLATHEDAVEGYVGSVINWTFSDRRQFAWVASTWDGDTTIGEQFNLVDPQHVVVRDMYLAMTAATALSGTEFNYFIELERVELTDSQAIMAIIQEESQSA
jgi:hypothetical protein